MKIVYILVHLWSITLLAYHQLAFRYRRLINNFKTIVTVTVNNKRDSNEIYS